MWVKFMTIKERIIRKIASLLKLSFFGRNLQAYVSAGGDQKFRYSFDCKREGVILDVGAFEGEFAKFHADTADMVICFETNKVAVKALHKRFHNYDNVRIYDFGIGSKTFRGRMVGKGPGASIVFDDNADVIIRDVVSVFEELNLNEVTLMKVNIEGGEFDLIQALCDSGLIRNIREIHIQAHDFADKNLNNYLSMHRRLSAHFNLIKSFPYIWDFWIRK